MSILLSPYNPQLVGMRFQGVDDELDVLVEVHAQQFNAAPDDLPIHLGSERLVLELLLYALYFKSSDALGPNKAAGDDKARQFVAGQQCLVHRRLRWQIPGGLMEGHGIGDFLFAPLSQP